jgi:DNA replication protein DnaC
MVSNPDGKLKAAFDRLAQKIRGREQGQDPETLGRASPTQTPGSPTCGPDECCLVQDGHGQGRFVLCQGCNPRLTCPTCHGTGHVVSLDPTTQAAMQLPEPCSCTLKERKVAHLNASGLPHRYLDASMSVPPMLSDNTVHRRHYIDALKRLDAFAKRAEARLYAEGETHDPFFALLFGPVGCGKTYLACALLKRLIMRTGASGRFIEFQQLMFQLRQCYSEGRSEEELLGPLRRADVLVIDELGKGRTESEWQMERLDDLVNSRYNEGKLTILTTNFAPLGASPENALSHGLQSPPQSEGFWNQTLADRVGLRIYDRIMEVAQVISFAGLPSLRRLAAEWAQANVPS